MKLPAAAALLVLVAVLWPDVARAGEPASSVTVSAGMGISVSDATAKYPEFRVESDFGLGTGIRGRVALELTGLPGDAAIQPNDPSTFRAAGAVVGLSFACKDAYAYGQDAKGQTARYVQQRIAVELVGGTWTRLVTRDAEPRDRFASEATAGLRVERRALAGQVERFVSVRVGHSGIAAGPNGWALAVVMEGRARVVSIKGAGLDIGARVDKALWGAAGGRDRFAVSVGAGW